MTNRIVTAEEAITKVNERTADLEYHSRKYKPARVWPRHHRGLWRQGYVIFPIYSGNNRTASHRRVPPHPGERRTKEQRLYCQIREAEGERSRVAGLYQAEGQKHENLDHVRSAARSQGQKSGTEKECMESEKEWPRGSCERKRDECVHWGENQREMDQERLNNASSTKKGEVVYILKHKGEYYIRKFRFGSLTM